MKSLTGVLVCRPSTLAADASAPRDLKTSWAWLLQPEQLLLASLLQLERLLLERLPLASFLQLVRLPLAWLLLPGLEHHQRRRTRPLGHCLQLRQSARHHHSQLPA